MKHFKTSITLGIISILLASCGPLIIPPTDTKTSPEVPDAKPVESSNPTSIPGNQNSQQTVTSPEQKEIRDQVPPVPDSKTTPDPNVPDLPTATGSTPVARPIPGKPGYVFNPWNHNPVYIQGIRSGSKVRDPADPNKDHIFRVP